MVLMFLENLFEDVFENIILKFWSHEEKVALLKLLYEIYNSDHDFSEEEVQDFNKRLAALDVDMDQISKLSVDNAVEILQSDKLKHDLIYIVLAEAVFKDEDYDDIEKEYMKKFVDKYNIDENRLKEKMNESKNRKIEHIMRKWIEEMNEGKYFE